MKLVRVTGVCCIALLSAILVANLRSRGADASLEDGKTYRVGIVDRSALAQSYVKAEEFYTKADELHGRFQEFQAAGEHEKLKELQDEMQEMQANLAKDFDADIEKTAAQIMEEMQLKLITEGVVASHENIEVIDVMPSFMETDYFADHLLTHSCGDGCSPGCQH